jgi:lactoylglutathione lyase
MLRITDLDRSRAFYEALGMELRRDLDIVRNGEKEATNYFFGFPGQDEELELTLNHDGRSYDNGTGYGHIAIGVDDLDATLAGLKEQGIEPERPPYQVREGGSWLCFVRDPDDYRVEIIGHSGS